MNKFTQFETSYLVQINIDPKLIGWEPKSDTVTILANGVGTIEVQDGLQAIAFIDPISGMLTHTQSSTILYDIVNVLSITNYMGGTQGK